MNVELSPFFFSLSVLSTCFLGTGSISCTLVFITSHITVATTLQQIPYKYRQKLPKRFLRIFFVLNLTTDCCLLQRRWMEWEAVCVQFGSCRQFFLLQNCLYLYTKKKCSAASRCASSLAACVTFPKEFLQSVLSRNRWWKLTRVFLIYWSQEKKRAFQLQYLLVPQGKLLLRVLLGLQRETRRWYVCVFSNVFYVSNSSNQ